MKVNLKDIPEGGVYVAVDKAEGGDLTVETVFERVPGSNYMVRVVSTHQYVTTMDLKKSEYRRVQ